MASTQTRPSELALPRQLTVFIGRTRELAEIHGMLRDPTCRLLNLVGAGGIGKTRLAVEAAATLVPHFANGAVFVPLQDATDPLSLLTVIAHALHCPLAGSHDPLTQLINFLTHKELILVLDNLEHLLDGVEPISTLLAAVPGVKILATSREVLNLVDEWLYPLDELPVPDEKALAHEDVTNLAAYDAVSLFVERAKRVRPNFLLEAEVDGVIRICQLVGGIPLALELAAAWLKTLTCVELADEIQQSLDILSTNLRNVAARHRSIRAVIDHSWQQLSHAERTVFMSLALFHGGFQRWAAQAVADATLPMLTTFVEKSLLRWEPETRRYQMHPLLRQYSLEQITRHTDALAQTHARHAAYYVNFARAQSEAILNGEQLAAVRAIEVEFHNIRVAWQWAVAEAITNDIVTLARILIDYYQIRSRYLEGTQTFAQAITRLRSLPQTEVNAGALALLSTYQGSLSIRLGRIDEAQNFLHEAQTYYAQNKLPPVKGYNTDPTFSLGVIALIQGDYANAARWGEQVLQTSERYNHAQNRPLAHYLLTSAALAQGELELAQHHADTACDLARATGSHWFMAYCLNELGNIAFALGNYGSAHSHYAESYALRQAFDDPEGMALALVCLGETALAQDEYANAHILFQKGQILYQQIGDQGGLAAAMTGLGRAAVGLQEWTQARELLQQALTLALAVHYLPYLASIFYSTALLLIATGKAAQGIELLATVAYHPITPHILANQIQQRLRDDLSYLAPDFLTVTNKLDATVDLETMAHHLRRTLSSPPLLDSPPRQPTPSSSPLLIEPLSEREMECLRLIATGLKNREIAEQLFISVNTVRVHLNNIYGKLGVSGRVQAVACAQKLNLL